MDPQGSGAKDRDQYQGTGHLSAYDRVTVSLWRDSHAAVAAGRVPMGSQCLAEAAAHALLAVLRRCADPSALLARYETSREEEIDFLLIASLVPATGPTAAAATDADDTLLRRIREASFHLRWLELVGSCST